MDENRTPVEPAEPEQGEGPRKGALVRATFYGDNAPTLEELQQITEDALRAKGYDVNVNRGEWT